MNIQNTLKKAILFAAFLIAFSSNNFAQTKLTLLYKNGKIKGSLPEYLKPNNTIKWTGKFAIEEFTINDTITYYETVESFEEKDEFTIKAIKKNRKNKIPGKTFLPNSNYCNYATGINIEEIEWKNENYLVKDLISNRQKQWILSEETRTIFGYPCQQAYIQNGEETEVVVWYTTNFKCNFSSTGDTTVPGTILETFYPKTGTLITLLDLQIETNQIMTPQKGGILVARDAFDKIKKNKKN